MLKNQQANEKNIIDYYYEQMYKYERKLKMDNIKFAILWVFLFVVCFLMAKIYYIFSTDVENRYNAQIQLKAQERDTCIKQY